MPCAVKWVAAAMVKGTLKGDVNALAMTYADNYGITGMEDKWLEQQS